MKRSIGALFFVVAFGQAGGASELLSGRVQLPSGAPVAGAYVWLFDLHDVRTAPVVVTTDADGAFALPWAAASRPAQFVLGPNYPNPFNPSTIIPYQLPVSSHVRLDVFNVLGQRIKGLVDAHRPAGDHTALWDGTDAAGRAVAAGVYLYRLEAAGVHITKRMVLIDGQAGQPAGGGAAAHSSVAAPAAVYGVAVSGHGIEPFVDPAFQGASGTSPLVLVVHAAASGGAGKAIGTVTGILGDVNNDNQVDLFDALLLLVYVTDPASFIVPNQGHIDLGDANGDGQLTLADVQLLIAYAANPLDETLPAGIGQEATVRTDEGNTIATADSIEVNSQIQGRRTPGDVDYFRVQVDSAGTLSAYSTSSLDLTGAIVDSNDGQLAWDDDSGDGLDFQVWAEVTPGVYYIVVGGYGSGVGDYTLNVALERALQPESPAADRAVLVALYEATGGETWKNSANWGSEASLDEWYGVATDANGSVVGLALTDNDLSGPIPPELGQLQNLQRLSLYSNDLSGPIPPELGQLQNLVWLLLYSNDLSGPIPPELGQLQNLVWLRLTDNDLSGPIPPELGQLQNLTWLTLSDNQLSGCIPAGFLQLLSHDLDELGLSYCDQQQTRAVLVALYEATGGENWVNSANWGSEAPLEEWYGVTTDVGRVVELWLGGNDLSGPIPPELGQLQNLTWLTLSDNELSGPIPPELAQLQNLQTLNLGSNELSGPIPPALAQLQNLQRLRLHRNDLSGAIPPELGQLQNLQELVLYVNDLSGPIPPELGQLQNLTWLSLEDNDLSGPIPPALAQLQNLQRLNLGSNELSGPIPPALAQLQNLQRLNLGSNELSGPIPPALAQLQNLQYLQLYDNELSGLIPPELAQLQNLQYLQLLGNELSGPIPPELGQLQNLTWLSLTGNDLSGPIPPELAQLQNLRGLWLGGNDLSGPIPPELAQLQNLRGLYLEDNDLSGPIPPELAQLQNLRGLYLEDNDLSGPIPPELAQLQNLRGLYLEDNDLSGPIPPELAQLQNLQSLLLYSNDLSGPIPPELGQLQNLTWLTLSGNQLSGCIPADLQAVPNHDLDELGLSYCEAVLLQ